ncbi:mitogen-activated protein kinase 15-like isoform X11 [Rhododendron vialii]|uniref:mitogen-activated protein kinase 15-like isoform X11 n=1 Tax=Rhododendron vialii TaxID=182163 RepID=UPI00265F39ED|nr:mitogen-activated protein kinase 15-like isoform X11 [Rhododendron vialii]
MSLLGPVGGLVWEIVSTTVVTYAVPWLSEFVAQRILPLWQRYWPVIYQSVLVPAYHLVSDTIQPLLHDLLSNHGDSSAVSASESPPGGTLPLDQKTLDPPQDHDSLTVSNVSNGLVSDHEDIIGTSLSEMHTPLDGGGTVESPHDQNIHASDPVLNPTTSMSSDNEDITRVSTSESPTRSEGGTPASADIDFFREYCEGRRYTIQEVIGKGSHGVVWSAYDTQHREKVAIKKISDVFRHVSDATRILREIKLLRILRHDDILKIKHILLPPSRGDFKDIYIVFELTECDLRSVIKANNGLKPEHCRYFLYQLLRGLKYIHTANVFHRDLNPRNILTIADCKIKIRHFSHAFVDNPTAMFWTDYVATRWYKAPELCGQFFSKYSAAIDIWSIGCIFAELLTGKPLFPGENPVHQLDLITDLLGTPSPESIAKIKNEKAHASLTSMRKKRPIPFPQKFPNADPLALVLLKRMLAFDPEDRPSAEEALADPYFKELARLESEPSAQPVTEADFAFERLNVTKEHIRELIYLEILQYHPKLLKKEHIEIPESNGCQSFSRRRRMLAKVASIAPMKLLHHPHPHLHPHPS